MVFVDSLGVKYAYKAGDTWNILTVPAYQADSLRRLGGASLAVDAADQPGIAVTWTKHSNHDSIWLSFFEYDGQNWHRFEVDSAKGWGPYDFWVPKVQYEPGTDIFHITYRAYAYQGVYVTGRRSAWQVEQASVSVGNWWYDFALHQGRPYIVCSSVRVPLKYQWRWAGGWEEELVVEEAAPAVSIAVDRTGRPHVAFFPFSGDTLYYARRLFVGTEEPVPAVTRAEPQLVVHPNPAPRAFTLEFPVSSRTTATISLCDASGRTVWTEEQTVCPGHYRTRLRLPAEVSPGVYFLRVKGSQEEGTARIVLR
ncbi:MAG: T9SS type A sorting domain-containing protein [candidate division WOR-3 bacterium]